MSGEQQAYHKLAVWLRVQCHGSPPARQLIRQQHLKAPFLQVLHLDCHQPHLISQMPGHGARRGLPRGLQHDTAPAIGNMSQMVHLQCNDVKAACQSAMPGVSASLHANLNHMSPLHHEQPAPGRLACEAALCTAYTHSIVNYGNCRGSA